MEKWMEPKVSEAKLLQLLNNEHLHDLMHKAAEIILSNTTQDPNDFSRPYCRFIKDARFNLLNHYGDIVIRFLNGQPEELLTPWGGWKCFDTDRSGKGRYPHEKKKLTERHHWHAIMPELIKRLGLQSPHSTVYNADDPERRREHEDFYVTKVDRETLWEYYGYYTIYSSYNDEWDLFTLMREAWERLERNRNIDKE